MKDKKCLKKIIDTLLKREPTTNNNISLQLCEIDVKHFALSQIHSLCRIWIHIYQPTIFIRLKWVSLKLTRSIGIKMYSINFVFREPFLDSKFLTPSVPWQVNGLSEFRVVVVLINVVSTFLFNSQFKKKYFKSMYGLKSWL